MNTLVMQETLDRRDCERTAYRKVDLRIALVLFVCFVFAYLNRVNISYAQFQLRTDIGLSDAAYGLGAGLFFFGYVFFEVPSNLLLTRIGAKATISRIMVLWGIISASTMFIQTPTQFYVARLLLGIAEAGFFPGAMLFFTFWYPATRRARVIGIFALAVPIAGVVGGIVSGWILHTFEGTLGLKAWQWLFLFEGLPPIVAGVLVYLFLTETPGSAKWLTSEERDVIVSALEEEAKAKGTQAANHLFKEAIKSPRIYIAAFVYTSVPWVASVVTYWGPQMIKEAGGGTMLNVGFVSAIPYIVGAIGMLLVCRSSDKRLERRWHWALSAILAASSIALLPMVKGNLVATVVVLSFATMGFLSIAALFFTIPLSYLSGTAAAGGIALISALGQTGGFAAPTTIGYLKQATGSLSPGLYLVACVLTLGAATVLLFIPASSLKERNAYGGK